MPELLLIVFRGSILQILPVLAVIGEDTAGIGNMLGLCTADILLLLWAVVELWERFHKKLKNVSCEYDRLNG